MDEVRESLIGIREVVRDKSLTLLSDALYRGDDKAKRLERQCAKISRAIDKAIHECENLDKMVEED